MGLAAACSGIIFGSHIMAALSTDREGFLAVFRMCCSAPSNVLIHFLPLGELGECPMSSGTVCNGPVSFLEESLQIAQGVPKQ